MAVETQTPADLETLTARIQELGAELPRHARLHDRRHVLSSIYEMERVLRTLESELLEAGQAEEGDAC